MDHVRAGSSAVVHVVACRRDALQTRVDIRVLALGQTRLLFEFRPAISTAMLRMQRNATGSKLYLERCDDLEVFVSLPKENVRF